MSGPGRGLPHGRAGGAHRFDGLGEFQAVVRHAIETGAGERWREAIFCDADFADWPLGDRAVDAALNEWARTGARFTLLAQRWDEVVRRHARFVGWRRRWSHLVVCRACSQADAATFPSALWTSHFMLHRLDAQRSIGVAGQDARRRLDLREDLQRRLTSSTAGLAATTLGL